MLTARTYPRRSDAAGADGGGLCVHAATVTPAPRLPPPWVGEGRQKVHPSSVNTERIGSFRACTSNTPQAGHVVPLRSRGPEAVRVLAASGPDPEEPPAHRRGSSLRLS